MGVHPPLLLCVRWNDCGSREAKLCLVESEPWPLQEPHWHEMHDGGFHTDPPLPPVLPFLFPGLLLPPHDVQRLLFSSSPRIHPAAASRPAHWPLQASCPLPPHVLTVPCPSPYPFGENLEAMARTEMRALPSPLCSSLFPGSCCVSIPSRCVSLSQREKGPGTSPLCIPWHVLGFTGVPRDA